jgi:DNA repair protein RadA/Sms
VIFGEIGLAGEVRAVSQVEARLREAAKLGFDHAILPAAGGDAARLASGAPLRVSGLRRLAELIDLLGGPGAAAEMRLYASD